MAARLRTALLFGGRSPEHDVSIMSAAHVHRALDPARHEVVPIRIERETGVWRLCNPGAGDFPVIAASLGGVVSLAPGSGGRLLDADGREVTHLDVAVPVLHGPNGEDGTIQGLLDLAGLPYVGSGVTGSAVAMDKDVAKRLMRDAGLPVVPFLTVTPRRPVTYAEAVAALGTPNLFVKPARMGSSVGVGPAGDAETFARAVAAASAYGERVLVERSIVRAREIECAVLETAEGELRASVLGEIAPAPEHGFYSYDAKYVDADGAGLLIPAELPAATAGRIRDLALACFDALCCEGLARVDFFVDPAAPDAIYLNEVNTLPGFTAISMYPKLWAADGLPGPALIDALVGHALARHRRRPELV
ncbi:D-alanine--D-alanine ligase family protein [Methylobacterium oryzihabitans]|uniref:D-alanine--D-alanine ligase n=1 Tax=Methylobacterium oryzihabitans TaxID=2499852 RepID=A0A3S2VA15_9HYPH|nr:D-alanine--D-alanine ligase family protein [Methylobacterium oryzihabitans]RVU19453.1 D-alanine--D-alanine ligase [Methylobacterium oryzihabitans]